MSSRTILGLGAFALLAALVACENGTSKTAPSTASAPPSGAATTSVARPTADGEPIVLDPAAKVRFESMGGRFGSVVAPLHRAQPDGLAGALDEKAVKAATHATGVTLATNGGAR